MSLLSLCIVYTGLGAEGSPRQLPAVVVKTHLLHGSGLGVGGWEWVFMEAWLHRLVWGSVSFFGPLFFGPVSVVWVLGFGFGISGFVFWRSSRLGARGLVRVSLHLSKTMALASKWNEFLCECMRV